jgi:hypothetical protein
MFKQELLGLQYLSYASLRLIRSALYTLWGTVREFNISTFSFEEFGAITRPYIKIESEYEYKIPRNKSQRVMNWNGMS